MKFASIDDALKDFRESLKEDELEHILLMEASFRAGAAAALHVLFVDTASSEELNATYQKILRDLKAGQQRTEALIAAAWSAVN